MKVVEMLAKTPVSWIKDRFDKEDRGGGGKQKHPCNSLYNRGAEIDSFYL